MKKIILILGFTMLLAGCPNDAAKKVAELETKVSALEKRNNDLEVKGRIVAISHFDSPLKNFFEADEFWENTYDSGAADCARRCATTLVSEYKVCNAITDCLKKQQCFNEALSRASNCQTNCSRNNQPPIP